jgi:hypothetical protein
MIVIQRKSGRKWVTVRTEDSMYAAELWVNFSGGNHAYRWGRGLV